MKDWKTIGIAVVFTLLVAVIGLMVWNGRGEIVTAPDAQVLSNLKARIVQFEVLKVEQTLMRDILQLQQEIRELQLKAQAPPVIEGEFIPIDKLPPEMQEQE